MRLCGNSRGGNPSTARTRHLRDRASRTLRHLKSPNCGKNGGSANNLESGPIGTEVKELHDLHTVPPKSGRGIRDELGLVVPNEGEMCTICRACGVTRFEPEAVSTSTIARRGASPLMKLGGCRDPEGGCREIGEKDDGAPGPHEALELRSCHEPPRNIQ